MRSLITAACLNKACLGGFASLRNVNLEIMEGEIRVLFGPKDPGKAPLISIICGIVHPSRAVTVGDLNIVRTTFFLDASEPNGRHHRGR